MGARTRTPDSGAKSGWLRLAGGWWAATVATVFVGRPIVNELRGAGLLRATLAVAFLAAVLLVAWLARRLPRRALIGVLAATAALLAASWLLPQPEERWHIVQFGALGALRWVALPRPAPALGLALVAGGLDETLQALLPDRVYDVTDLVLNACATVAGIAIVELGRRLGGPTMSLTRRGVPIVVSAPSGAGKTTLCHALMQRVGGVEFSVSHTTRKPRGQEKHGVDYWFVDDAEFARLVKEEQMLEWADVHGKRYGTSRREAETRLPRGIDVLFDIDVQGGRQLHERLDGAVLVFVLPPDPQTLEKRLRERKSDSEEQIARRLEAAKDEIRAAEGLYSYWIVNDDLDTAVGQLQAVLEAERLRRSDTAPLVRRFLGGAS
jgi:guanylate kinase